MANEIGIQEPTFTNVDFSTAPQVVIEDADKIAHDLVGNDMEKHQKVMNELVGAYIAASQADIIVFFNSGGMGWNYISNTPGWESILNGITSELESLGHHPLVLNYSRTNKGIWGNVKEVVEAATRYTKKIVGEEKRLEFLMEHLPNLDYIIAGESTGDVITEQAMMNYRDNPNVYSIQTGCPFWYKTEPQPRTLRIDGNSYGPDAFTNGDLPAMIWSTFKGWFGMESPEENAGNVLKSFRAPGHDYSWTYESINSGIIGFLEDNFPKKN